MVQTIESKGQLTAIVTDFFDDYVDGLKEVEKLVQKHNNLRPVDLPTAIKMLYLNPEIKEAIKGNLNTNTSETRGLRYEMRQEGSAVYMDLEASYEVLHGAFPVITHKSIEDSKRSIMQRLGTENPELYANGVCYINNHMWASFGSYEEFLESLAVQALESGVPLRVLQTTDPSDLEKYFLERIPRFFLDDLKRGNVPKDGTPYAVSAYDSENPGPEDHLAMLLGGYDNLEIYEKITRYPNENGVEGLILVDNQRQITDIGKDVDTLNKLEFPIGRGVYLDMSRTRLIGGGFPPGHFLLSKKEPERYYNYEEFK